MSTALAEQLKRLAVPQTSLLTRDKRRPSLLFDPKEAANLKREDVYQIGIAGFEELKSRNPLFAQFEQTLFSSASKEFERAVHDEEENKKLDKNIRKFLILLSPYFLLNCSHKALEWLINRFHIQDYNKEDLLMLILPYHETNIFVRALQLLHLKDERNWRWLRPLQKPGIHLPKQALYNHAASDVYFISFVSKFIFSAIAEHEKPQVLMVAFNFYWTTFVGALENSNTLNEAQVARMLPIILKGLTSPIPDFCAATYAITSKLLTKETYSEKILNKFVEKVTKFSVGSLHTEAIVVLVILYQKQAEYKGLPDKALKNMIGEKWISKTIQELKKSKVVVDSFLEALLKKCIELIFTDQEDQQCKQFVDELLNQIHFDEDFVHNLFNIILDEYSSERKYKEETSTWLQNFINKIENQHPVAFDEEIRRLMKTTQNTEALQRQNKLKRILNNSMNVMQGSINLLEKLYHPNPKLRIEAVKFLIKQFNKLKDREKEMLQSVLLDRLNDDDSEVVSETLFSSKQILILVVEKHNLKKILIKLLGKCQSDQLNWWKVANISLEILCSNFIDMEAFFAVFPFLLPISDDEIPAATKILKTDFLKNSPIFGAIEGKLKQAKTRNEFVSTVLNGLNNKIDVVALVTALKGIARDDQTVLQKYLTILLLSSSLPQKCPLEISTSVLEIFVSFLHKSSVKTVKKNLLINCIVAARNNRFPLEGFLQAVGTLIEKTETGDDLRILDFSDERNRFFVILIQILLEGCNRKEKHCGPYLKTLETFFKHFCVDFITSIEFLLNIAVSGNVQVNQLHCLMMVKKLIVQEGVIQDFVSLKNVAIPYILILLNNSDAGIREYSLELLKKIVQIVEKGPDDYVALLKAMLKHYEEIFLDQEQIPLILYKLLSNQNDFKEILNLLINLICDHKFPIYLNSGILRITTHLNNFEILTKTCKVPLQILNENDNLNSHQSEIVYKNILRLDYSVAGLIDTNTSIWDFLALCLSKDFIVDQSRSSILVLDQVDRIFFDNLQSHVQQVLLENIVEVATTTQIPDVLSAATRVFKRIDLDANLVLKSLEKMRDIRSPKQILTKRRRVSQIPTVDILDTLDWRKGVTVLEFFQDKKKVRNTTAVIPVLFEILKKCLDFDEQPVVEYPKQLLLSTILHCCGKSEQELPENAFNMELVVQCIRASQNPQTHHHALLVLSHLASVIPQQVLHHIMAVFTFMGSSVLRHDDAYSFQIISKIIDTIIPILIEDGTESTTGVLRVFVDAILDIPEHRRKALFKQLLTRLVAKENLHYFLLLVFEAHVVHGHTEKPKSRYVETPKRLDIAADLCREFSPEIVIFTCTKLIEHLRILPEEKNDDEDACKPFLIKSHSAKQFRHYKYILVTFIPSLLGSKEFVGQVAAVNNDEMLKLEILFKELIVATLSYIQITTKITDKNINTPQAQYWKAMLHYSYEILDCLNALLTSEMFLLVITSLMSHNLNTVRRRTIELLNTKLQHNSTFFKDSDETKLFAVIAPLINAIKLIENEEIEPEQELIVQTAFLSLKLLVKLLAPNKPEKFLQLLTFVADIIKFEKVQGNILASVLLCLAELCGCLRAHAISSLNKFMPALLRIFKIPKNLDSPNLLLISLITTVHKILDSLPLFLSPYLKKLFCRLSTLANKWDGVDNPKTSTFMIKLDGIKQKIGSVIPPRILIPSVSNSYVKLLAKNEFSGIGFLMKILNECLVNLHGADINANLPELTTFFLKALQFRSEENATIGEINQVESHVINTLVTLILKLSESSFRPLYYRLFDWAIRTDAKSERVITFYRLSSNIANCLKGLFVLFAGHFVANAASLLDACNTIKNNELYFEDDHRNCLLLDSVLETLHAVFLYDSQKFVNKERFEVLMQPLADQIENTLGGSERLEDRGRKLLIPCVVQFAVATGDDALWKLCNYQILLKTRHNSSAIRLLALETLGEVAKKLGEDFLPLLPETIPFLAELLEDEDENVEKACQKTVQELGKVLGEPLQKYF